MRNYGFIEPKIDRTHYVLGSGNVPDKVLQENGDWTDYLPDEEKQFNPYFDTYNCTSFNTLNQIEIYMLREFGIKVNYSDRFLGIVAGTDPKKGGNDPHTVMEAVRKYGLIPEEMLPFTTNITTVEEYYSFKGGYEDECYKEGQRWLEQYNFMHEWVFTPDQPLEEKLNNIKVALKYSPISLSVYAWLKDARDIYISLGYPNHWTSVYGYEQFIKVFDSYEPFRKLIDQNVLYCKRIHIDKKVPVIKTSFWQKFLNLIFREKLIFNKLKYENKQ